MIFTSILLILVLTVNLVVFTVPIATNSLNLVLGGERANVVEDYRDEWYDREYNSKEELLEAA